MAADGAQAGAGEDGRVARALEIVSADAELGGLVQLLAAALQLRGMSVTDLEDGRCRGARARGHQQSGPRGWAGWIVDWASESYCWLQQPGVFDSMLGIFALFFVLLFVWRSRGKKRRGKSSHGESQQRAMGSEGSAAVGGDDAR